MALHEDPRAAPSIPLLPHRPPFFSLVPPPSSTPFRPSTRLHALVERTPHDLLRSRARSCPAPPPPPHLATPDSVAARRHSHGTSLQAAPRSSPNPRLSAVVGVAQRRATPPPSPRLDLASRGQTAAYLHWPRAHALPRPASTSLLAERCGRGRRAPCGKERLGGHRCSALPEALRSLGASPSRWVSLGRRTRQGAPFWPQRPRLPAIDKAAGEC
ncbi:hypothetical protein DMC30DRAFT_125366 [Rhodotorula diobovata]|uniref:Uncharacterized protein n=1 Tax=Rhodotorula diobovata TaxID=5288 RepID=A0A5C5FKY6_9BASI|nr:hypothetical protein DMC30DRAFT_125366 [Rhodotorula diobovata]